MLGAARAPHHLAGPIADFFLLISSLLQRILFPTNDKSAAITLVLEWMLCRVRIEAENSFTILMMIITTDSSSPTTVHLQYTLHSHILQMQIHFFWSFVFVRVCVRVNFFWRTI